MAAHHGPRLRSLHQTRLPASANVDMRDLLARVNLLRTENALGGFRIVLHESLVGRWGEVGEDRVFGPRLAAVTTTPMTGRAESLKGLLGSGDLLAQLTNMVELHTL